MSFTFVLGINTHLVPGIAPTRMTQKMIQYNSKGTDNLFL